MEMIARCSSKARKGQENIPLRRHVLQKLEFVRISRVLTVLRHTPRCLSCTLLQTARAGSNVCFNGVRVACGRVVVLNTRWTICLNGTTPANTRICTAKKENPSEEDMYISFQTLLQHTESDDILSFHGITAQSFKVKGGPGGIGTGPKRARATGVRMKRPAYSPQCSQTHSHNLLPDIQTYAREPAHSSRTSIWDR